MRDVPKAPVCESFSIKILNTPHVTPLFAQQSLLGYTSGRECARPKTGYRSTTYSKKHFCTQNTITQADSGSHCRISAKQYPLLNMIKHKGQKTFRSRNAPLNFSHTYVRLS
ncbi:hypothetical protein UM89_17475 [Bacillus subtilis]|nr:hypothetical protein UM89_17475 [Bacillus subtilis]